MTRSKNNLMVEECEVMQTINLEFKIMLEHLYMT